MSPKQTTPEKTDDVDPAAAEAEAAGVTMSSVSWDGEDWEVPTDRMEWDVEAVVALEEGRFNAFLKAILGPLQWRRFTAGKRRTARDADDLSAAIIREGFGATKGE